VRKLPANSIVQLCSINEWSDYSKPFVGPGNGWNQRAIDALKGWGALEPHRLMTYDYCSGYGWAGPLPLARRMAERLRHYRTLGVSGVYNETTPHWGPQGLMLYMFARLAWNPDLDVNAELSLYYRNYYGPAAAAMKAYHEAWMEAVENRAPCVSSGGRGMHAVCTPALIDRLGEHLRRARAEVRGQALYERRMKGVCAGYEVARQVCSILKIKKASGTKVDTVTGPFAGRSSYLHSDEAGRVFEELAAFMLSFDKGDAVFDLDPERPGCIVLKKMRGDVLRNRWLLHRGHEAALLRDF